MKYDLVAVELHHLQPANRAPNTESHRSVYSMSGDIYQLAILETRNLEDLLPKDSELGILELEVPMCDTYCGYITEDERALLLGRTGESQYSGPLLFLYHSGLCWKEQTKDSVDAPVNLPSLRTRPYRFDP